MLKGHEITHQFVESRCKTPGHTDLLISCECGWEHRVSHGNVGDASQPSLFHRVQTLEEEVDQLRG